MTTYPIFAIYKNDFKIFHVALKGTMRNLNEWLTEKDYTAAYVDVKFLKDEQIKKINSDIFEVTSYIVA